VTARQCTRSLSTDVPSYTGEKSAAEVAVSADGRFVYTSNRGDHAMVVHAVDPKSGTLTSIQRLRSGGPWPWHFALHKSGKWLLVANRDADALALVSVDKRSGLLSDTGKRLATPRPVQVAFTGL
jgi:6-phosphogluconolactonase (cycloisomerase 2 family)